METVVASTGSLARAKGIEVRAELSPDLPIGHGDERRLTQVLLNIVGNAIKFTDTGSVEIRAKAMDDHFIIAVQDTGPGIPPRTRRAFSKSFNRLTTASRGRKVAPDLGCRSPAAWSTCMAAVSICSRRRAWVPRSPSSCRCA